VWFRCWRVLALQALVVAVVPAAAAGETSTTLRVSARVVERCTFTTRPLEHVPEHARLRVQDVLEARCDRDRLYGVTIGSPVRSIAVEQPDGGEPRHLQITITY
jgi:hypothetical protein